MFTILMSPDPFVRGAWRKSRSGVNSSSITAKVATDNVDLAQPENANTSTIQQQGSRAQRPDRLHVVAHEDARSARSPATSLHLAEALLLELSVSDGQHLVDDEDLGVEVRSHGKRESHVHAARVALHRRIEEATDLAELDDLVELAP